MLAAAARALASRDRADLAALDRALRGHRGATLAAALADVAALAYAHGGLDALRDLLLGHAARLETRDTTLPFAPLAGSARTVTGRPHHARLLQVGLDWSSAL